MPVVPEFLLRKLIIPGITPCEGGFTFQLRNTLASVSVTRIEILVDHQRCNEEAISISLDSISEIPSRRISTKESFSLPVNSLVSIRVMAPLPQRELVVITETKEAGKLNLKIPLKGVEEKGKPRKVQTPNLKSWITNLIRTIRAHFDPQHPKIHFTPPANWMNDPNGLIDWKGAYHLFYQHNPFEPVWGNMHWGHATSPDLLHWKHKPIALRPDPNGVDAGGCFSGCVVAAGETPVMFYTGVFPETQCMATCRTDDLNQWDKHPQPVISGPPPGMKLEGFRDPCVWKQGDEWRMAIGSGIHDRGGAVLLYSSTNLTSWHYLGILYQKDPQQDEILLTGTMWECPSFFPLGEKWVLIISACSSEGPLGTIYFTGDYQDDRFIADGPAHRLDHGAGACFYAPQTFLDRDGKRVMLGWLRECRNQDDDINAGWSGVMSLPRVLLMSDSGKFICEPSRKISILRDKHETLGKPEQISSQVKGSCIEIYATIPHGSKDGGGLLISTGTISDESILISDDFSNNTVVVDCRIAGGSLSVIPVDKLRDEDLRLHIFLDGSAFEMFVNDRIPISARYYMNKPQALRVQVIGDANAELWSLKQKS